MSKYKNKKNTINGITYDSKKEANRHRELLLLEQAGEIKDLKTQVKFVLIPAQREPSTIGKRGGVKRGKLLERECAYIADFVYMKKIPGGWRYTVEDVKGYRNGQAYAVFSIKRKLMLSVHGIRVKEV